MLGDFPAGVDSHYAADAAEHKASDKSEADQIAEIPEGITADSGADKNAEFVHKRIVWRICLASAMPNSSAKENAFTTVPKAFPFTRFGRGSTVCA